MDQTPKIIILILSTNDKRYNDFVAACKNTWVKQAHQNSIKCFFYQGGEDEDHLSSDTIYLKVNDSLAYTGEKLYKALHFIERQGIEYDYIFRTNLSSYIFMKNLIKFIKEYSNDKLYSGIIGSYNILNSFVNKFNLLNRISSKISKRKIVKFASGSGFFISRNNVQIILKDQNLNFSLIDDVMVGECLARHEVSILKATRIDLNDNKITYSNDIDNSPELIKSCYHIRLKSKDRSIDVNRFFALDKYDYYPFDNLDPTLL